MYPVLLARRLSIVALVGAVVFLASIATTSEARAYHGRRVVVGYPHVHYRYARPYYYRPYSVSYSFGYSSYRVRPYYSYGLSVYRPYTYSYYSPYYYSPYYSYWRSYVPSVSIYGGWRPWCSYSSPYYSSYVPLVSSAQRQVANQAIADSQPLQIFKPQVVEQEQPQAPLQIFKPQVVEHQPAQPGKLDVIPAAVAKSEPIAPKVIERNWDAERESQRDITAGSTLFQDGKFAEALKSFEQATQRTPELEDSWFHQGAALVALGRHRDAAVAFRKGLDLNPQPQLMSLPIAVLYPQRAEWKQQLDALASSALQDRNNADIFFLLGAMLHFDGQQGRSEKFLSQAVKLNSQTYLAYSQGMGS